MQWFKMPITLVMMPKFQRLSIEAQAGFITLCCQYWHDEGNVEQHDAEDLTDALNELVHKGFIEIQNGMLHIDFLEEQLDAMAEITNKRKQAGAKGGQARAKQMLSKSQANAKQVGKQIREDKDIDEDKEKIRQDKIREESAEAVVFPWDSDSFREIWQIWCKFRTTELGKRRYKQIGEQAALKKLSEMSGGDESTARQIIEQSISNSWQGLFPLKNQNNGKQSDSIDFAGLAERISKY